jgi:hypothetical protein
MMSGHKKTARNKDVAVCPPKLRAVTPGYRYSGNDKTIPCSMVRCQDKLPDRLTWFAPMPFLRMICGSGGTLLHQDSATAKVVKMAPVLIFRFWLVNDCHSTTNNQRRAF